MYLYKTDSVFWRRLAKCRIYRIPVWTHKTKSQKIKQNQLTTNCGAGTESKVLTLLTIISMKTIPSLMATAIPDGTVNVPKGSFLYRCKYRTFQFCKSEWNWNTNWSNSGIHLPNNRFYRTAPLFRHSYTWCAMPSRSLTQSISIKRSSHIENGSS